MTDHDRLRHVLSGQRFPAARWELIAGAEYYGADERTRRDLHALPAARFRDVTEVLRAVAARRTADTPG